METKFGLVLHHVGCLTNDIEQSLVFYRDSLGFKNISEVITVASQEVKVCFVETAPGVFLELVQPTGENASLRKILKSKNPYYHTGYLVNDMNAAIEALQQEHCYLVNRFVSEAFENRECAFLYTPEMQLLELIENKYAV